MLFLYIASEVFPYRKILTLFPMFSSGSYKLNYLLEISLVDMQSEQED